MKKEEAIKYLQQLYPNGGHCWLDEQRIEAIDMAVKALQEEPVSEEKLSNVQRTVKNCKETVSEDFENALAEEWKGYNDRGAAKVDALEDNTQELAFAKGFYRGWHYMDDEGLKKVVEGVSEDLGKYINELSKQFPEVSFAKLSRIAVRVTKWQKENLWKPANGDDLPEIDREVIAILNNGKVVFAHRPPEYWDGKNIITGKVTRNYPKTYGKGGWNIPNIVYWLDVELPKEIEL